MAGLSQKNIIVGISGGIAAYKSAELVRLLSKAGANVQVVLSQNAREFITPLTLQALSGNPVRDHLCDHAAEAAMGHIELARFADQIIIAPASANSIARLAHGFADDLLSTICLATTAPISIAPAMNQQMWANAQVQANLDGLEQRGITILGPASGEQACGDIGLGRMLEPLDILTQLQDKPLHNIDIMITAGPTVEAIDPVRFLSNPSSGKMGFALAKAARQAGANVCLITGPVSEQTPAGVTRIDVRSAHDMRTAVMTQLDKSPCDLFIGAAAVANYRSKTRISEKLSSDVTERQLTLIRNPDIIKEVAQRQSRPFMVGFAAQTDQLIAKARAKLNHKNLDLIIANDVSQHSAGGFNSHQNAVSILSAQQQFDLPLQNKTVLAEKIIAIITQQYEAA